MSHLLLVCMLNMVAAGSATPLRTLWRVSGPGIGCVANDMVSGLTSCAAPTFPLALLQRSCRVHCVRLVDGLRTLMIRVHQHHLR